MKKEKHAIFFIALPGAGKSTYIENNNLALTHCIVSADDIKENHLEYNPKRPDLLHEWSVKEAENKVYSIGSNDYNIVFDGGGINNSYNVRIISKLKEYGYYIKIININTPLIECLLRNEKRERTVPRDAIIEKYFSMQKSIDAQKPLANEFIVIDYFTNENVFFDMDGVLCEYKSVPWLDVDFDYVNSDFFKNSLAVIPVINIVKKFNDEGKKIFILSASPNSITNNQKLEWLSTHLPFINKKNVYFVGNKEHKTAMLESIMRGKKMKKNTVMIIDDDHKTIDKMLKFGVNAYHPSKLLSHF